MRSYSCYYFRYENKHFNQNSNTACWRGLGDYWLKDTKEIYIKDFKYKETEEYIPLLISIINKITPCELVLIGSINYIKYTLFTDRYDNNLVLLNFIRNLWCQQTRFEKYNVNFLKALESVKDSKDGLVALSYANVISLQNVNMAYSPGHSNIYPKTIVKTTKELSEYKGNSTREFLTTK